MQKDIFIRALSIYLIVTTAFFLYADHGSFGGFKDQFYFAWDKNKDLFLVFGIFILSKDAIRSIFKWLTVFFFFRFIWQLFELENYAAANRPYVIDILFLMCVSVGVYQAIKSFK